MKKRFTINASADLTDEQAQMFVSLSQFAADDIAEIEKDYGKKLSPSGWGKVMDYTEEIILHPEWVEKHVGKGLDSMKAHLDAVICDIYEDDTGITGIYESEDIRCASSRKSGTSIRRGSKRITASVTLSQFAKIKSTPVKVGFGADEDSLVSAIMDMDRDEQEKLLLSVARKYYSMTYDKYQAPRFIRDMEKHIGRYDWREILDNLVYLVQEGAIVPTKKAQSVKTSRKVECSMNSKRKFVVRAATSTKRKSVECADRPITPADRKRCIDFVARDYGVTKKQAAEWVKEYSDERIRMLLGIESDQAKKAFIYDSTSTKRKFVVKAACGKRSVKSASRPVTQKYITKEFVEKANNDYLTQAYEDRDIFVILIEDSDIIIRADGPNRGYIEELAMEIAEDIYPQYGIIKDHNDLKARGYSDAPVGSAVKCATDSDDMNFYEVDLMYERDGGFEDSGYFEDWRDAEDFAHNGLMRGFWVRIIYAETGDTILISPDEYREAWDNGAADFDINDEIVEFKQRIVESSTDIMTARRDTTIDKEAVRELVLYITNDGDLYRQRVTPMIENLKRKVKKGVYDREKAVKLWQYLADEGVKKYGKEFGPGASVAWLNPATREEIARELRDYYEEEVMWEDSPVEASSYMIVPDSGTVPFDSDIIDILAYYGYNTLEDFALASGIRDFVKAKQILLEKYAEDTGSGYSTSDEALYADLPEVGFIDDTPYL